MNRYPKLFCIYLFFNINVNLFFFTNKESSLLFKIYLLLLINRVVFFYPINVFVFLITANNKKREILETQCNNTLKKMFCLLTKNF